MSAKDAGGGARIRAAADVPSARAAGLAQATGRGLLDSIASSADAPIDIRSVRLRVPSDASSHDIARAVRRAVVEAARRRR